MIHNIFTSALSAVKYRLLFRILGNGFRDFIMFILKRNGSKQFGHDLYISCIQYSDRIFVSWGTIRRAMKCPVITGWVF